MSNPSTTVMSSPPQSQPRKARKPRLPRRAKTVDFLGLLPELRNMVYEEIVRALPEKFMTGQFNRPDRGISWRYLKKGEQSYSSSRSQSKTCYSRPQSKTCCKEPPATNKLRQHQLLYTCKQVHAEYVKVLYLCGAKPVLNLAIENITSNPITKELNPFWQLSPILKEYAVDCEFRILWTKGFRHLYRIFVNANSITGGFRSDPLSIGPLLDPMANTFAQFTKLKKMKFHLIPLNGTDYLRDDVELLAESAFDALRKVPTLQYMEFQIGHQPHWKGIFEKRKHGGWDVSVAFYTARDGASGAVTYQLTAGEPFKKLPAHSP
ncbi:hypothetical protein EJ08DRAFT_658593 [Tothia fuscella]|uniref:Uncharacterized protein n=1 Tax=Tothia fuscella TaxID=1048955 RepID=A0A9P4NVA6_9PEZI|nr:hypothetical protein EJ08DRAFT_658593 [Tothia fuscella]